MVRILRVLLLAALSFPFLLSAEIIPTSPAPDKVITGMDPELKKFLMLPKEKRRERFLDKAYRKKLNRLRDAVPTSFTWKCTKGEKGEFTLCLSGAPDFSAKTDVYCFPADSKNCSIKAVNFRIGQTYYWKIRCTASDGTFVESKTAVVKTEDFAPRLMRLDKVGNVRDLGGRCGLDGKRIRQGMIFRSAGLNANSPDFSWKKDEIKIPLEKFRIGATRIQEPFARYVRETLGWKTDLDLRSKAEVASMKESPVGSGVRWIHHSSSSYGGIFHKGGKKMTAENFRLFCDRKNYPIVFHCIAGADRTGALAYLLNAVLGVPADELEKDWEITANSYFRYEKMFDNLANGFDSFGSPDIPLSVKAEKYLLSIGVKPDEIARFRSIMLE